MLVELIGYMLVELIGVRKKVGEVKLSKNLKFWREGVFSVGSTYESFLPFLLCYH